MKTTNESQLNKIHISIERFSSVEDLKEWRRVILRNLLLLKGRKTSLITLSPQSYSIGYELDNCQKLIRAKKEYLINWDITLTEDVINFIANSEEFERQLLFIVLSENMKEIFEIMDMSSNISSYDFSKLFVEIIVLENDGETLIWNNPSKEIKEALLNT
jgi:hypothetical protein